VPTTTIILIRHAEHDGVGRMLTGRAAGIALNARGREQARRLAAELAPRRIAHVISSPRLRARQTAQPIAEACALPLAIGADFDELDYGDWTGRSFAELSNEPQWRRWNEQRATSRPPRGESMAELQARVLRGLAAAAAAHPGQSIVIVSHAEPIRAALLHCRGLSLNAFASVPVEPASIVPLSIAAPDAFAPRRTAAVVTA
jgi:broad specificity phosphatase PhoE